VGRPIRSRRGRTRARLAQSPSGRRLARAADPARYQ
jgi:hypothetical protein